MIMFWNSSVAQSCLNEVLNDPDLKIDDLLDEDDVLQKCHERDQRLITFLSKPDHVDYMVNLITTPPKVEPFDADIYRQRSLACEILTCDISELTAVVVRESGQDHQLAVEDGTVTPRSRASTPLSPSAHSSPEGSDEEEAAVAPVGHPYRPRLHRLLNALRASSPAMNPLSASFLTRVITFVTQRYGSLVIPYMRSFPNLLESVLSNFHMAAMVNLLTDMMQQMENQRSVFEWFLEDGLVELIVEELDSSKEWEFHEAAAHCFVQMLTILRNYLANYSDSVKHMDDSMLSTCDHEDDSEFRPCGIDPSSPYASSALSNGDVGTYKAAVRLLEKLESEDTIKKILGRMLTEQYTSAEGGMCTSVFVSGVNILVTILNITKHSDSSTSELDLLSAGVRMLFGGHTSPQNSLFNTSVRPPYVCSSVGRSLAAGRPNDGPTQLQVTAVASRLVSACLPYLPQLHRCLTRPHQQTYGIVPTTGGTLDPPFGKCRLALVNFLSVLATLPPETGIQRALLEEGILQTLMDLVMKYPLNTLLHHAFRDIITSLFYHAKLTPTGQRTSGDSHEPSLPRQAPDGSDSKVNQAVSGCGEAVTAGDTVDSQTTRSIASTSPLDAEVTRLLGDLRLTDWCLHTVPLPLKRKIPPEAADNTFVPPTKWSSRPGYSGHLWELANLIQEARTGGRAEFVNRILQGLPSASQLAWEEFASGDLATVNLQQTRDNISNLGGNQQDMCNITQTESGFLLSDSDFKPMKMSRVAFLRQKLSAIFKLKRFSDDDDELVRGFHGDVDDYDVDDANDYGEHTDTQPEEICVPRVVLRRKRTAVPGPAGSRCEKTSEPEGNNAAEIPGDFVEDAGEQLDDEDDDDDADLLHSPVVIKQHRSGESRVDLSAVSPIVIAADPWCSPKSSPVLFNSPSSTMSANWADFGSGSQGLSFDGASKEVLASAAAEPTNCLNGTPEQAAAHTAEL